MEAGADPTESKRVPSFPDPKPLPPCGPMKTRLLYQDATVAEFLRQLDEIGHAFGGVVGVELDDDLPALGQLDDGAGTGVLGPQF